QSFDLSKTEWRLDGDLIANGPQTSFNGLYGNAHIGFNVDI
ncbi:MAG: hypothetical protein ACI9JN_001343, partial [Bacteroidia bacterium]